MRRAASVTKVVGFFFGPDRTCWDLIRIGSALIILVSLFLGGWSGNYERFYGHYGVLPRRDAVDLIHWPGFLFLMKSGLDWIWWIYGASWCAALCLAFGLCTRVAAVATWFLYIATIERNLMTFNGETGILAFMLLALIFAPTPQPYSLDHRLLGRLLPARTESWPARFIQINVCLMYLFTTIAKALGSWDLGTGEIWYQITLSDWFRFGEVEWLRAPWICWLAVHSSVAIEGAFVILIWTRLRLPLVLGMMLLHLGIAVLFANSLFLFNIAAIVALCAFLKYDDFARLRSGRFLRRQP